jgi:predicted nuclease of predicted toxin-antitoxin system
VKFIVDQHLPRRLVAWICERGHEAVHVRALGLE